MKKSDKPPKPRAQAGNNYAKKHGHTWVRQNGTIGRSPTYQSWRSMIARCYHEDSHPWFHAYGGRGIQVTDRWRGRGGFANFLADMGERPPLLTLDRADVDGDYYKGNCRWADKSTQRTNIRNLQPLPKPARSQRKKPKPKVRKRRKIRAPARDVVERSIRTIPF